ncbi:MAG TPA: hypothetical protein VJ865_09775 [Gemmatimonadaceae bacterium]|nr:hypothetical protein [Gemmatimonadaceae bacterium]
MTDEQKDPRSKSSEAADTDAGLQKELSREAAEGSDSIGDVSSNRTLTGSSSWETLPDQDAGERDQKSKNKS